MRNEITDYVREALEDIQSDIDTLQKQKGLLENLNFSVPVTALQD